MLELDHRPPRKAQLELCAARPKRLRTAAAAVFLGRFANLREDKPTTGSFLSLTIQHFNNVEERVVRWICPCGLCWPDGSGEHAAMSRPYKKRMVEDDDDSDDDVAPAKASRAASSGKRRKVDDEDDEEEVSHRPCTTTTVLVLTPRLTRRRAR